MGLLAEPRGQPRHALEQAIWSVSLGSPVVSIASLAWTVYTRLKQKTPSPAPEAVARNVRVELRNQGDTAATPAQVVEVVVTEVIKAAEDAS